MLFIRCEDNQLVNLAHVVSIQFAHGGLGLFLYDSLNMVHGIVSTDSRASAGSALAALVQQLNLPPEEGSTRVIDVGRYSSW
ncbi:MAG: hypothetical protein Q8R28_22305 [Dehalococcoidia bacterium]|nr:hypothetical protein [Dehalococcoidia bacterium]